MLYPLRLNFINAGLNQQMLEIKEDAIAFLKQFILHKLILIQLEIL